MVCTLKGVGMRRATGDAFQVVGGTPLSALRSLPTRAVSARGDLPVVTAAPGTHDTVDSQFTHFASRGARLALRDRSNLWRDLGETMASPWPTGKYLRCQLES